jgi:hypothetical protein
MSSYFQGAIRSGDNASDGSTGVGTGLLSQTALVNFDATLVQGTTFSLPKNAQVVDIVVDVLTAYNSATSATVTVGTAAAGTQYAGAVDGKTAGRVRPTFSAAQLAAMDDIGTSTTMHVTATSVGQPTAGQFRVTVLYTGGAA